MMIESFEVEKVPVLQNGVCPLVLGGIRVVVVVKSSSGLQNGHGRQGVVLWGAGV